MVDDFISKPDRELTLMIVFFFILQFKVVSIGVSIQDTKLLLSYCGAHPLTLWLEYSGLAVGHRRYGVGMDL